MGNKEDAVRKRLEREAQDARRATEQHNQRQEVHAKRALDKYNNVLQQIYKEVDRVAKVLEAADWSTAVLRKFYWSKSHPWSRKHSEELACLPFRNIVFGWRRTTLWMRSDGTLWMNEHSQNRLQRPDQYFSCPYNLDSAIFNRMDDVFEALRSIRSINDCTFD